MFADVGVIAAPPVNGSVREARQSAASRLVTGEAAHLASVVDGSAADGGVAAGSYYIRMEPVQPLDGSSYGDNCSIAGNTITCLHGPQRLWFDIYMGGWAPDSLKVYQIGMSYSVFTSGAGAPLVLPGVPCTTNADCEPAFGSGSLCSNAGNTKCQFAWEDASRQNYHSLAIAAVANFDPVRWGATGLNQLVADPGTDVYAGSLAVDAQAGSFGVYTLDFLTDGTTFFTLADGTSPDLALFTFTPAVVELPFGRCCVFASETCADDVTPEECNGLGGLFVQDGLYCNTPCDPDDFHGQCCLKDECVDELTQAECVAGDGYIEFHADQDCSFVCPQCRSPSSPYSLVSDPYCDDGDACTRDRCNTDLMCEHTLRFDESVSCCDGNTGHATHLDDGNPCTTDSCDGSGPISERDPSTAGTAVHTPVTAGTPCDLLDLCTSGSCDDPGACQLTLMFDPDTQCCNGTTGNLSELDDGMDCTIDGCSGSGIIGERDASTAGVAVHLPATVGTPCDVADLCTMGTCGEQAACEVNVTFDPATECCDGDTGDTTPLDDGNACTVDACDGSGVVGARDPATAGLATHTAVAVGTPCDVDDVCTAATCTEDEACEVTGLTFDATTECCNGTTGVITQLDDGRDCTIFTCNGAGNLGLRDPSTAGNAVYSAVEPAGTTCHRDDGDLCTAGACNDYGFCGGSMVTFDPATECCDGDTGEMTSIDDGDACTTDACDGSGAVGNRDAATAGTAIHEPLPPAPADLDDNCAIDLADYDLLLGCLKGPNTGFATPACPPALRAAADLDDDNDIDLADAADLFTLLTSP